ncbi:MAG TPA: restriction endonuclease [Thermoanaerobaculia bacterium]
MEANLVIPSDCLYSFGEFAGVCPLCLQITETIDSEEEAGSAETGYWNNIYQLQRCPCCSWWSLSYKSVHPFSSDEAYARSHTLSAQVEFSIGDKDIPLFLLREHLAKKVDNVFDIHPRKFEEIICSIFREHGFAVELREYSKDGGVDLIVFVKNDWPTAVQVKRYKKEKKIGLGEIHQFLGAMMVSGFRKGIYVTTSSFTRGARHLMDSTDLSRLGIELQGFGAEEVQELVTSFSPRICLDPWFVAWELRKLVPTIETVEGDWGGVDINDWPWYTPTTTHVDWWVSQFRKLLREDPSIPMRVEIPPLLSVEEVESQMSGLKRGEWVELFRLKKGSPPHHSFRGQFWELRENELLLGNEKGQTGYRREELSDIICVRSYTQGSAIEWDF